MPEIMTIILPIIGVFVGLLIGVFIGITYRKRVAEAKIGSAEVEATRLINEAIKNAESKKKEILLESKEEVLKNKAEADREIKERRDEVKRQEKRVLQKEETLDRKTEQVEQKNETLTKKLAEAEAVKAEAQDVLDRQWKKLEEISGFTTDQAKEYMLSNLEHEIQHDYALKLKEAEQRLKEESEAKAREVVTIAIQKYAADYVAEATVSGVPLPSDDMKGRIIGREGRNIRTIETLTGVDLIIDDTPEAITVSSFDPVRREVARQALERLIHDGRIHPAKIEETVEKVRRDIDAVIKQEGERAAFDTGVHGLHPELIKLLSLIHI